jgi:hypothetical protein
MRLLDKLIARLFPFPAREPVPVLGHSTSHVQSEKGVVLIARFTGVSGFGCSCADTERQIRDVIFDAFHQMRPDALVYDFQAMEYRWGDNLTETFCYHPDARIVDEDVVHPEPFDANRGHFPVVYAVSDLNRVGLTSLLREEMDLDPSLYLFETLDEAVIAASQRITIRPAS